MQVITSWDVRLAVERSQQSVLSPLDTVVSAWNISDDTVPDGVVLPLHEESKHNPESSRSPQRSPVSLQICRQPLTTGFWRMGDQTNTFREPQSLNSKNSRSPHLNSSVIGYSGISDFDEGHNGLSLRVRDAVNSWNGRKVSSTASLLHISRK